MNVDRPGSDSADRPGDQERPREHRDDLLQPAEVGDLLRPPRGRSRNPAIEEQRAVESPWLTM